MVSLVLIHTHAMFMDLYNRSKYHLQPPPAILLGRIELRQCLQSHQHVISVFIPQPKENVTNKIFFNIPFKFTSKKNLFPFHARSRVIRNSDMPT